MKIISSSWLFIFMLFFSTMYGQQDTSQMNADELYKMSRELAFKGNYEAAQHWLKKALIQNPTYLELRTFLGKTYAWQEKFDQALPLFEEVLAADPKNKEASYGKLDVFLWSNRNQEALDFANKQLRFHASDTELLIRKAKAQIKLKENDDAVKTLDDVLAISPNNEEAKLLMLQVEDLRLVNSVQVLYRLDHFTQFYGNAHYEHLELGHKYKNGSYFARVNLAQRFKTRGTQFEFDWYPTFQRGFSAFLNYAYSETDLFPKHKLGGEIFKSLPAKLEISAGMRYFYFNRSGTVSIYTGSLGWYVGNWWLNGRVFLTPDSKTDQKGESFTFVARRYLNSVNNYVGIVGGFGYSANLTSQVGIADNNSDLFYLRSHRLGLEAQRMFGKRFVLGAETTWGDLELPFNKGNYVDIWTAQIRAKYLFKKRRR